MDKWFHPTLYGARDYLSMLGLKLIRVAKEAPGYKHLTIDSMQVQKYLGAQADVSRVHYDF